MSLFTLVAIVLILSLPVFVFKTILFSGANIENIASQLLADSDMTILAVALFAIGILMLKLEGIVIAKMEE